MSDTQIWTAEQRAAAIKDNRPRPYDLNDSDELLRLYRECKGYLQTCHGKHGTDWAGRQFAIDALKELGETTKFIRALAARNRRKERKTALPAEAAR